MTQADADLQIEILRAELQGDRVRAEQSEATIKRLRSLCVEADSMLSAYGHGRRITKEEALELSGRLRSATEAIR